LLENQKFATESTRTPLRELTIKKNFKFSTSEFTKICHFEITKKFAPSPDPCPGDPPSALRTPNVELALTPLAVKS